MSITCVSVVLNVSRDLSENLLKSYFYIVCDSIYIQYKNRQNKLMLLEVRLEVILSSGEGTV